MLPIACLALLSAAGFVASSSRTAYAAMPEMRMHIAGARLIGIVAFVAVLYVTAASIMP